MRLSANHNGHGTIQERLGDLAREGDVCIGARLVDNTVSFDVWVAINDPKLTIKTPAFPTISQALMCAESDVAALRAKKRKREKKT